MITMDELCSKAARHLAPSSVDRPGELRLALQAVRPMTKVACEPNGDAACIPNAFLVIIMKSAAEFVTIYRRFSTFTTDMDLCAAGHRPSYRVIAESPDGHSDDGYGLHIP